MGDPNATLVMAVRQDKGPGFEFPALHSFVLPKATPPEVCGDGKLKQINNIRPDV